MVVQNAEHDRRRLRVAQYGEAAQVRDPDNCVDRFVDAAIDGAVENPPAGAPADIGAGDRLRDRPHGEYLDDQRQRWHQRREAPDLGVGKPSGDGGGKARGIGAAVAERHRQHDVVCHALAAQVVEDGEIVRAVGIGEPTPDAGTAFENQSYRAAQIGFRGLRLVVSGKFFQPPLGRVPDIAGGGDHRMQRADQQRDARQRQSRRRAPCAQATHQFADRAGETAVVGDPVANIVTCLVDDDVGILRVGVMHVRRSRLA